MSDSPKRKLAAVMFTVMVGYTSMMQEDEDKARDLWIESLVLIIFSWLNGESNLLLHQFVTHKLKVKIIED